MANLGFFADQTVALFGQPEYGFTSDEVILVRAYYDPEQPSIRKIEELADTGAELTSALADYSLEIAGLSGQRISEEERIRRFHSYLGQFRAVIVDTAGIPPARYDQVLASVARQETFLGAIREFQPVIDAVGRFGQFLIAEYEAAIHEARDYLDAAIHEDFAALIQYTEVLEQRHGETLIDIAQLVESESPSRPEEKALAARLDRMQRVFELLEPRWQLYQDTLEELDELHTKAVRSSGRERLSMLLWVRAHQRMSAGLETTSWFDIDSVIGEMLD